MNGCAFYTSSTVVFCFLIQMCTSVVVVKKELEGQKVTQGNSLSFILNVLMHSAGIHAGLSCHISRDV